jgi:hypothetical protein
MTENGYQTIAMPFPEITPTPSFRMEARWTLEQLLGYFSTWSATNRFIKATGLNPIDPLRKALANIWSDPHSPRQVVWPLALRVGIKAAPAHHSSGFLQSHRRTLA